VFEGLAYRVSFAAHRPELISHIRSALVAVQEAALHEECDRLNLRQTQLFGRRVSSQRFSTS
jgi:hypothetical protein